MIDRKVKKKEDCTGCYSCVNTCPENCIYMYSDDEGFEYPKVDYYKCIQCNKCIDACPIINKLEIVRKPVAYACINKDEYIRLRSSSGGIFTLIAEQTIGDGGVVFGAGFNEDFEVAHSYIETVEGIDEFRGSKYVQSKICEAYKQVEVFLKLNRKVVFSGTPCQISGLKSYLRKAYDNLVCIDIICHGVPSPDVWKKYIKYREERAGSPVKKIAFRRKDEGWKRYSVSLLFENNTEYRQNLRKDSYMRAFLKNVCLRPSCYKCNFKTLNRQSDITLADFWGIQNLVPELDDDKGTSLVLVNSKKGQSIFNKIKDSMVYKEVDISQAIANNSSAIKSVLKNTKRQAFFSELKSLPFDELVDKYCRDKRIARIKRRIISILRVALKATRIPKIYGLLVKLKN